MRFGPAGSSEEVKKCVSLPFASDTSPKWIDREGLGKRPTGTRLGVTFVPPVVKGVFNAFTFRPRDREIVSLL